MSDSAKQKIAIQLIAQVNDFPPLPAVVNKILQVSSDPERGLDELTHIVEAEVGLSASIIKLANSPFFGLSHEVSSIPHALAVLGMDELRNMVLAKVLFNSFSSFRKKGEIINFLWKHSFCSALAAQIIGKRMGRNESGLFVAGLIHDIGKMVIFLSFSKESLLKIYGESERLNDSRKEIDFLGLNHEDLGRLLVKRWLFPDALQMAVGYHHSPESAPSHQVYPLVAHLADTIALLTVYGIEGEKGASLCLPFLDAPLAELYADYSLPLTVSTLKDLCMDTLDALAHADDLNSLLSE